MTTVDSVYSKACSLGYAFLDTKAYRVAGPVILHHFCNNAERKGPGIWLGSTNGLITRWYLRFDLGFDVEQRVALANKLFDR